MFSPTYNFYSFFAKEVENKVIHEIKKGSEKLARNLMERENSTSRKNSVSVCGCVCVCVCVCVYSVTSDSLQPMDYSPTGSSVHGILQVRILAWVTCPPPGDLSNPGIEPMSSALQVDSLPTHLPGKPQNNSRQ